MIFTTYNLSDGSVCGVGSVLNPDDLPAQAGPGQGILEGVQATRNQKVVDGVLIDFVPPPLPPAIPTVVSPWQIRRALNASGLRSQVETAIEASNQDTKDGWEFASEFRRDNSLVNTLAASLNISPAQVDDLFVLADSYR